MFSIIKYDRIRKFAALFGEYEYPEDDLRVYQSAKKIESDKTDKEGQVIFFRKNNYPDSSLFVFPTSQSGH